MVRLNLDLPEDPLLQVLGTLEADTPDLAHKHNDHIVEAMLDKTE